MAGRLQWIPNRIGIPTSSGAAVEVSFEQQLPWSEREDPTCLKSRPNWEAMRNGCYKHMGVSKNRGTPKSWILIGFSIINHPFWGTPIFGNTHIRYFKKHSNCLILVPCKQKCPKWYSFQYFWEGKHSQHNAEDAFWLSEPLVQQMSCLCKKNDFFSVQTKFLYSIQFPFSKMLHIVRNKAQNQRTCLTTRSGSLVFAIQSQTSQRYYQIPF